MRKLSTFVVVGLIVLVGVAFGEGQAKPKANTVILVYKAGSSSEWAVAAIIKAVDAVGGDVYPANFDSEKDMRVVRSHLKDLTPDSSAFKDNDVLIIPILKNESGAHLTGAAQLFGPTSQRRAPQTPK